MKGTSSWLVVVWAPSVNSVSRHKIGNVVPSNLLSLSQVFWLLPPATASRKPVSRFPSSAPFPWSPPRAQHGQRPGPARPRVRSPFLPLSFHWRPAVPPAVPHFRFPPTSQYVLLHSLSRNFYRLDEWWIISSTKITKSLNTSFHLGTRYFRASLCLFCSFD